MAMFEMQQHPPIGFDGKQFTSMSPPCAYGDYGMPNPEFGSPSSLRSYIPQPPAQFHNDSSDRSMFASPPGGGGYFSNHHRQHRGTPQFGGSATFGHRSSFANGRFYEHTPRSSRRQHDSVRHQLTPVRPSLSALVQNLSSCSMNDSTKSSSDESHDDPNRSYELTQLRGGQQQHRSALPTRAYDAASGSITYTFEQIVDEGLFDQFARDKAGCHFLQENYPEKGSALRKRLYTEVVCPEKIFEEMCKDVFANFFVQKMIELSTAEEQVWIASRVKSAMFELCLNRYSCRVIQKVIEVMPEDLKAPLLSELHPDDLLPLSIDQNANHVIQKIFNTFEFEQWRFIVMSLMKEQNFFDVVENKYGCRVVQLAIELLSDGMHADEAYELHSGREPVEPRTRGQVLHALMGLLLQYCEKLSSNEFANYVIQHVIVTPCLGVYREQIIERCLLTKLLSLSQEKYASHVVEKALDNASPPMLREMMDEIFDGYVPDSTTKKDALDILLFHQFGNYVVQRMLQICLSSTSQRLERRQREMWLGRLEDRITRNASKLLRYSSGKKIIDMLRSARGSTPYTKAVALTNSPCGPRVPDGYR